MKKYDPSQPLLGLHIPKSAGTSLQQVLSSWCGRNLHWHYFNERRNEMPRRYRRNIFHLLLRLLSGREILIYGHFNRQRGFGIEDYYPGAGQFFSIVRDPLATIVSSYFFAKQMGQERMRAGKNKPIAAQYHTLNEFVAGKMQQPYFVNFLPGPMTLENYAQILDTRFVYIGVAEDLQTSIDHLAVRLGFKSITVPHANPSRHNETLDPALAEAFVRSRPLEYAIYGYALDHYRG